MLTFLDIETSENIGRFWRPGKQFISHKNIIQERVILCAAWCHDDEGVMHYTDALQFDKNGVPDDRLVCEQIVEGLADTTVVVHHNGDKFDMPWIAGRCLANDVEGPPKMRSIDTYKVCRRQFNLNSYALDYIAKFLGYAGKNSPAYSDWADILNGDKAAYQKMIEYNIEDVEILRQVYNRIRPRMSDFVWFNVVNDEHDECTNCGHTGPHQKRGWVPNLRTKYRRYMCTECGTWLRSPNVKQEAIEVVGGKGVMK